MTDRQTGRSTQAAKHIRKGHTVVVIVVGSYENVVCETCNITLTSKKTEG